MKVTRQVPNEEARNFYNCVDEFLGFQVAVRMSQVEGDFYTTFTLLCGSQEEADKFESLNF
jgi:hypothetical protein